jgi:hypothetical protein
METGIALETLWLDATGAIDQSQGTAGTTETKLPFQTASRLGLSPLMADGARYMVGAVPQAEAFSVPGSWGVARLTAGGQIDETFGHNGLVVTEELRGGIDRPTRTLVQADGKPIVVGGFDRGKGARGEDLFLVRYLK